MKKPRKKKPSIELKQWAAEQAMRWPQIQVSAASGVVGGAGMAWSGGGHWADADVIGRAKKLLEFITD